MCHSIEMWWAVPWIFQSYFPYWIRLKRSCKFHWNMLNRDKRDGITAHGLLQCDNTCERVRFIVGFLKIFTTIFDNTTVCNREVKRKTDSTIPIYEYEFIVKENSVMSERLLGIKKDPMFLMHIVDDVSQR